jgi:hypothetical protein
MAHFWQGTFWSAFRTGDWLTAARARGYSMILLNAVWLVASFAAYLAMLRAILLRGETLLIAAAATPRSSSISARGKTAF